MVSYGILRKVNLWHFQEIVQQWILLGSVIHFPPFRLRMLKGLKVAWLPSQGFRYFPLFFRIFYNLR